MEIITYLGEFDLSALEEELDKLIEYLHDDDDELRIRKNPNGYIVSMVRRMERVETLVELTDEELRQGGWKV